MSEKKYYALPDFDEVYDNWNSAQKKQVSLGIKDRYAFGFTNEKEAKELVSGNWENYFKNSIARYTTKADAVVCVDGSWTSKTVDCGYGICIFFKNGETYCESAKIVDGEIGEYTIIRYDDKGEWIEDAIETYDDICKLDEKDKHGYALASLNVAGEIEAAMRAIDICIREKGLNSIDLIFDCTQVEIGLEGNAESNVVYKYQKYIKELRNDFDFQINFKKADSHSQVDITEDIYPVAVYNDLVDILGKAEAKEIDIPAKDVPNLTKALPDCQLKGFYYAGANTPEKKRNYIRSIYKSIVERIPPVFVN